MLTAEQRSARLAELDDVMGLMRPAVQQDGGDLQVVSVDPETGVVRVTLQGACSSCAISSATLQGGVSIKCVHKSHEVAFCFTTAFVRPGRSRSSTITSNGCRLMFP